MTLINKTICPICQRQNKCMAHTDQKCWCSDVIVPQQLIELIPKEYQGKQCICRQCIEQFALSKL